MKQAYEQKRLGAEKLQIIEQANAIIADFARQGHELTLRQLYYQFVAKALIPNTEKSYHRLGGIISDGRMNGLISWTAIVDRTRNLRGNSHWDSPADIISASANGYAIDLWKDQDHYVEIWVEKDAVAGIAARIANELDVNWFSCRGYTSQSEMWLAGIRLRHHARQGRQPVIIHLGDHDPSGQDMTNDIAGRLELFMEDYGESLTVDRIALNFDQIQRYNPPPNPAKVTDPRAGDYIKRHGPVSWELDALSPTVMTDLIRRAVLSYRDEDLFAGKLAEQREARAFLKKASDNWDQVEEFLAGLDDEDSDDDEE